MRAGRGSVLQELARGHGVQSSYVEEKANRETMRAKVNLEGVFTSPEVVERLRIIDERRKHRRKRE